MLNYALLEDSEIETSDGGDGEELQHDEYQLMVAAEDDQEILSKKGCQKSTINGSSFVKKYLYNFLFHFGDFLSKKASRASKNASRDSKNADDNYHLLVDNEELDNKQNSKEEYDDQSSEEDQFNFTLVLSHLFGFPLILFIVILLVITMLQLILSPVALGIRVFDHAIDHAKAYYDSLLQRRVAFIHEYPYNTSSYYTSTESIRTLIDTKTLQVDPLENEKSKNQRSLVLDNKESYFSHKKTKKTRLAIVRPFYEFDVEYASKTFECWECFLPCKAVANNTSVEKEYEESCKKKLWGDTKKEKRGTFFPSQEEMGDTQVDLFLHYSQTFSDNYLAVRAMDTIIDAFNSKRAKWSQCFHNIYAIEGNIPREMDLYIPSAQEELSTWVNGPNRQYESSFRIIQSGAWGEYDAFYMMEGDSIPIRSYWLDDLLREIEYNRPFAILGSKYGGDKWDAFQKELPVSLLDHLNGNAIYNTSHPLMDAMIEQLESEAKGPYNSIPYDYRMSQIWVEGSKGIVPELPPKIMLDKEGKTIILPDNRQKFKTLVNEWIEDNPFKESQIIKNQAATNLIPRYFGTESIIHGAKICRPWNPSDERITLVLSEWTHKRSKHLLSHLDEKDHPFSEVVIMLPNQEYAKYQYNNMTMVPTRSQYRMEAPDWMDLCEARVETDWFMMTNSYHQVSKHVDLMYFPVIYILANSGGKYVPGGERPVVPYTPATYEFCFQYPYCKEIIKSAQGIYESMNKYFHDFDVLYHTETRNKFCDEWKRNNTKGITNNLEIRERNNTLFDGPTPPTGTLYMAYVMRENSDGLYRLSDRTIYGSRYPFIKVFAKEEILDGIMSKEVITQKVAMGGMENLTLGNTCLAYDTVEECEMSSLRCSWRPRFESCRPAI